MSPQASRLVYASSQTRLKARPSTWDCSLTSTHVYGMHAPDANTFTNHRHIHALSKYIKKRNNKAMGGSWCFVKQLLCTRLRSGVCFMNSKYDFIEGDKEVLYLSYSHWPGKVSHSSSPAARFTVLSDLLSPSPFSPHSSTVASPAIRKNTLKGSSPEFPGKFKMPGWIFRKTVATFLVFLCWNIIE